MSALKHILQTAALDDSDLKHIHIKGHDPVLPSPFLIGEAGAAVLAAIGYILAEHWYLKTNRRQKVSITVLEAAIAQRSQQYLKVLDGETKDLWDPISGFYQTQDGRWIQLHCNAPQHRAGVIQYLGCQNDKTAVAAAVKQQVAAKLETVLSDLGLCAAMVRTPQEWLEHPQAAAVASLPLFEIIKIADTAPIPMPEGAEALSGIKMLDLSRVLAGPICGRVMGEYGASVMRISHPQLSDVMPLIMDTGHNKLSAFVDLDNVEERANFIELIKQADVFSQAYRPAAMANKGFGPEAVAEMKPGIVYVSFSAYSHVGPWANRHGYDSLVQSVTGIVAEQSHGLEPPQHMPAQALDYIAGFLGAFAAMEALRRRALHGGSYLVRISLLQVAHWLKSLGRNKAYQNLRIPSREQIAHLLIKTQSEFGLIEHLRPVLQLSETQANWHRPPMPLGHDPAKWP